MQNTPRAIRLLTYITREQVGLSCAYSRAALQNAFSRGQRTKTVEQLSPFHGTTKTQPVIVSIITQPTMSCREHPLIISQEHYRFTQQYRRRDNHSREPKKKQEQDIRIICFEARLWTWRKRNYKFSSEYLHRGGRISQLELCCWSCIQK